MNCSRYAVDAAVSTPNVAYGSSTVTYRYILTFVSASESRISVSADVHVKTSNYIKRTFRAIFPATFSLFFSAVTKSLLLSSARSWGRRLVGSLQAEAEDLSAQHKSAKRTLDFVPTAGARKGPSPTLASRARPWRFHVLFIVLLAAIAFLAFLLWYET